LGTGGETVAVWLGSAGACDVTMTSLAVGGTEPPTLNLTSSLPVQRRAKEQRARAASAGSSGVQLLTKLRGISLIQVGHKNYNVQALLSLIPTAVICYCRHKAFCARRN